jgi:uncharacterized membrane protein YqaE (UPF0057 family)
MFDAQAAIWTVAIVAAYFLPWIVASLRKHRNAGAIALLNLFLGWTLLGWLAALIWSATANVEPEPQA